MTVARIAGISDDRRLIDAWLATRPTNLDGERQRDDRVATEWLMIRKAIALEAPSLSSWGDPVAPPTGATAGR